MGCRAPLARESFYVMRWYMAYIASVFNRNHGLLPFKHDVFQADLCYQYRV